MRKFTRCPDCGCTVDKNLVGHHSAADCSILKYAERHDDAIRMNCACRAGLYIESVREIDSYRIDPDMLELAILGKEAKK